MVNSHQVGAPRRGRSRLGYHRPIGLKEDAGPAPRLVGGALEASQMCHGRGDRSPIEHPFYTTPFFKALTLTAEIGCLEPLATSGGCVSTLVTRGGPPRRLLERLGAKAIGRLIANYGGD